MSIVGKHPERGVRLILGLTVGHAVGHKGGPPWRYEGTLYTPQTSHTLSATVAADGSVQVEADDATPQALVQRAKQVIRTACKHAQEEAQPPPRQIHRWRAGNA
jgi:hypothetical protein